MGICRGLTRVLRRPVAHAAVVGGAMLLVTSLAGAAWAMPAHSPWAQAQKVDEIGGNSTEVNTPVVDGCPMQSPDGRTLYLASNRTGTLGGLDIWVAHRTSSNHPWGAPENLGPQINSTADDFCPTPVHGGGLFFVSSRPGCGLGDIYFTRLQGARGWTEPVNLGCHPAGPNSALNEMGPSFLETHGHELLYFSSGPDIHVSRLQPGGSFSASTPVPNINSSGSDIQPSIRRDGLEIVFASNRSSGSPTDHDLYAATRERVDEDFGRPVTLGPAVNTLANETRPSLSWDGQTLYFGRAPGPEGGSDIYVSTRETVAGPG